MTFKILAFIIIHVCLSSEKILAKSKIWAGEVCEKLFDVELEVCTGSKLKPEPGPYPRLSDPTRPDPSGTVKFRARTRPEIPPLPTNSQLKKKEKGCISRLHAKKQINQGSAISQTFTSYDSLWTSGAAVAYILPSLWILYEDNSSTVQIMVIFCQLRLVSILSTLNQT